MTDSSTHHALIERLTGELGGAPAEVLVTRLAGGAVKSDTVAAVLVLIDELQTVSAKVARAAMEALPELDRRVGLSHVVPWLDVGTALAESSGATALKYFKDSPLILGLIEQADARAAILAIALEQADQDANVALEYLRAAPHILSVVPYSEVRPWLEIGVELTRVDVVVGLEYIRQISALAPVLPIGEVRTWVSFGMKLIVPDTLGKPSYLRTIEFLRRSPAILGEIDPPAVRSKVLSLGILLAERSPQSGAVWLAEAPRFLHALPSAAWQVKTLQCGALLAEKDSETALSYLRRCPEIIGLIGEGPHADSRFEQWFRAGMEVLAYSPEGARAYFGMESQKALSSVEQALSGVPLRQVARRVKLFVQGLCGTDVAITALPDSVTSSTSRATVSADGLSIALPAMLRRSPTVEANERWYLLMAAHEAGHLEFGTYRLKLGALADLVEAVRRRYGRSEPARPATLASLFRLYPYPRLVQDLWVVLEDARIEFLLKAAYPGLRRELARAAAETITPRDPGHGLAVKELIVDCLLRLSTGESEDSAVPHAVKDEVRILWSMGQRVLTTTATAEDAIRLVHDLYVRLEELLAPRAEMNTTDQRTEESQEQGVGPTASEQMGDRYRSVTNWEFRGVMNPELITQEQKSAEHTDAPQEQFARLAPGESGSKEGSGAARGGERSQQQTASGDVFGEGRSLPAVVEELFTPDVDPHPVVASTVHGERAVRYPEWDYRIQDYRMNWCRVVERPAAAGSDDFVSSTLTTHHHVIKSLRRFFESLRPPAFRRIAGQADGEDLDLEAMVRRAVARKAGAEGSDRIYIRREKRARDVAAAFLIDVSGSTSRQLATGRRVIDIERESLVLLCEALEAVGDQYGLYAYSGQGRAAVDFLTIKDFDDRLDAVTAHRLGALGPRQQNRDGAAIRHATAKLLARDAKTRILMLLSDGRPLDGEYKDEYSLEDTKTALRDARHQGVDAFCVTIDHEADGYLRRMYGDVGYSVIDRIETLPTMLPRIYRRLAT